MADYTTAAALDITWKDLHRDTLALARRLAPLGPFKGVLAVARGGLVPAAIVARELGLRLVDTVCVVSYSRRVQGDPVVVKAPPEGDDGAGWVVVDDLVDSGVTFRTLRQTMPHAHYAAVYAKPKGRDYADTWVVDVDQDIWLVFPWDAPEALGG